MEKINEGTSDGETSDEESSDVEDSTMENGGEVMCDGYDNQGCINDEWWETNLDDSFASNDANFVPGDDSMLEGDELHASEDEEDLESSHHEDISNDQFKYVMQVARFLLILVLGV